MNLEYHFDFFVQQANELIKTLQIAENDLVILGRYDGRTKNRAKQISSPKNWFVAFCPYNWLNNNKHVGIYYEYRYALARGKCESRLFIDVERPFKTDLKLAFKDTVIYRARKCNAIIDNADYHPNAGMQQRRAVKPKLFCKVFTMTEHSHALAAALYAQHHKFNTIVSNVIKEMM